MLDGTPSISVSRELMNDVRMKFFIALVALSGGACFQPGLLAKARECRVVFCRGAPHLSGAKGDGAESLESLAARLKQGMGTFKDFDELEPEAKRAKVSHYMDLTGCKDRAGAEASLSQKSSIQ